MDVSSGTEAEALELVDLTEVIVGLHEGRPLIVPRTVFVLLQRESETKGGRTRQLVTNLPESGQIDDIWQQIN